MIRVLEGSPFLDSEGGREGQFTPALLMRPGCSGCRRAVCKRKFMPSGGENGMLMLPARGDADGASDGKACTKLNIFIFFLPNRQPASGTWLMVYQKHFIYRYILFTGYTFFTLFKGESNNLLQRSYPGKHIRWLKPDGLHVSGGSNPNAYMPRLQILYACRRA